MMSTTANILKKLDGRLIINGELVAAKHLTEKIKNPATGEIVGKVGAATVKEVNTAVNAASAAFLKWGKTSPKSIVALLRRWGGILKLTMPNSSDMFRAVDWKTRRAINGGCTLQANKFLTPQVFRFAVGADLAGYPKPDKVG